MLRNRRGATSLRWLRALLDHGIEVHGQIVVCPGVNDGPALEDSLVGVLDRFPELASLAVVPLGISRHSTEPGLRRHTVEGAGAVVDTVEEWQTIFHEVLGRRLVFAADEYYLLAGRPFPEAETYEGFPLHEDGIGMARAFERELLGLEDEAIGVQAGFFSWVDGAPAEGYRAPRAARRDAEAIARGFRGLLPRQTAVLTGEYGARVIEPLIGALGRDDVRVVPVRNEFFGGNIAVTGLLTGPDLARVLGDEPEGHRYLLPDVCLSNGVFLDGSRPEDLPRPVEVVPTDGVSLRRALTA
jgi:NifB/MoaA-like Fe-S oxidoreductase